jgi:hypothetical protein
MSKASEARALYEAAIRERDLSAIKLISDAADIVITAAIDAAKSCRNGATVDVSVPREFDRVWFLKEVSLVVQSEGFEANYNSSSSVVYVSF